MNRPRSKSSLSSNKEHLSGGGREKRRGGERQSPPSSTARGRDHLLLYLPQIAWQTCKLLGNHRTSTENAAWEVGGNRPTVKVSLLTFEIFLRIIGICYFKFLFLVYLFCFWFDI